jgi:AraC-like DNA-binding protein
MMYYISTSIFQKLLSSVTKKGLETNTLLKKANIKKTVLASRETKVPLEYFYSIMAAAIEMTGDDYLGLHIGENADPGDLSVLGYIIASCRNLRESFEKLNKYSGIMGSTQRLSFKVEGDDAKLVWDSVKYFPDKCIRHSVDLNLSNTYKMILNIADEPVEAKEVWFNSEPPSDSHEYNRVFNCSLKFNQPAPALVFSRKTLEIPIKHSNPMLISLLEPYANGLLNEINEKDYFSKKISLRLFESIQGSNPTIRDVAKDLGMCVRVLQSKLKEEGVTFSELATNVRLEIAKSYLCENRYTIDDITYLIGFSEPSVFRRAFKRWTGMTPSQFRSSSESVFKARTTNSYPAFNS